MFNSHFRIMIFSRQYTSILNLCDMGQYDIFDQSLSAFLKEILVALVMVFIIIILKNSSQATNCDAKPTPMNSVKLLSCECMHVHDGELK